MIQSLGYVAIGARNIDDWARFATGMLGMEAVDRAASPGPSAWTTARNAW